MSNATVLLTSLKSRVLVYLFWRWYLNWAIQIWKSCTGTLWMFHINFEPMVQSYGTRRYKHFVEWLMWVAVSWATLLHCQLFHSLLLCSVCCPWVNHSEPAPWYVPALNQHQQGPETLCSPSFCVALSLSLDWHERFCIDVFSIFLSNFVSGDLALTDFKFLRWTSYFHCFETLGSRAWCPNSAAVPARGQNSATSAGLAHGQWLLRFHSLGVAWKGLAIVFPWVVENQPMLSVCQPSSPRLTLSPALQVWWAAKKQIVICNKLHDILCACYNYCLLWEFEQQSLPMRACNLSQVRVKRQNLATESLSDKFLIKKN